MNVLVIFLWFMLICTLIILTVKSEFLIDVINIFAPTISKNHLNCQITEFDQFDYFFTLNCLCLGIIYSRPVGI